MNIYLNVNDLVEQLVKLTENQNEAIKKASELSEKVQKLEQEKMDKELEELKKQQDLDRWLEEQSKNYENVSELDNSLSKIVTG